MYSVCVCVCVCVCVYVLRCVTKVLCYSNQIPSSCPGTHIPRYWQVWLSMAPSHTPQWELSSAAQNCLPPGSAPSWGWSMTTEWLMHGKKPSPFASILGQFRRSSWLQNSPKDHSRQLPLCFTSLPQSSPSSFIFLPVSLKSIPQSPFCLQSSFSETITRKPS